MSLSLCLVITRQPIFVHISNNDILKFQDKSATNTISAAKNKQTFCRLVTKLYEGSAGHYKNNVSKMYGKT